MIKWIIQNNLIKPAVLKEFQNAFEELDISFEEIMVIPFSVELPQFIPADLNIFYGSTTLMLNAYQSEKYGKGVFYDPELFNVNNYLDKWGENMLNAGGEVLSFKNFIEEKVDLKSKWFIRPNNDTKSFSGMVMTAGEIKEWYEKILNIDNPELNSDTLIFASEEKTITKEWRNFIVNGKVVDSSRYILNGELDVVPNDLPLEMIEFVEACSVSYTPHTVFVMDVAETANGFKIIECNCFNGTGFYGHNIKKIVKAITAVYL